jgi:hypothetical protein
LAALGRSEEVVEAYRRAVDELRPAVDRDPRAPEPRARLYFNTVRLAVALRDLGRFGEAAAAFRAAAPVPGVSPAKLLDAARQAARGAAAAGAVPDAGRAACAEAAVTLMSAAVRRGYKDVAALAADPAFAPLRDRPDFRALTAAPP